MPLSADFDQVANVAIKSRFQNPIVRVANKRPAPFSIRLSEGDRARLAMEAAGAPLGAYIKSKILNSVPVERKRRKGLPMQDREALAQALALLGRSELTSSLAELVDAVRVGSVALTPETEHELRTCLQRVLTLHKLMIVALGFKSEGAS